MVQRFRLKVIRGHVRVGQRHGGVALLLRLLMLMVGGQTVMRVMPVGGVMHTGTAAANAATAAAEHGIAAAAGAAVVVDRREGRL